MRNFYKTMATGTMVVALAGLTGCATTGDLDALKAIVDAAKNANGQITKQVYDLLEQRDKDGKTCFFTAVECA